MSREQLIQALNEAAESLETISRDAGKVDTLESMYQVRPYAANRARAARAALSATQPAQAAQPVQGVQSETCPTCGESEPYSGACGTSSSDMRALCKRKAQAAQGEPLCDDEGCDHHGTPHVCVNNKQPAQGAGEVVASTYVQSVPDKCDRIVWRGRYYGLPITQPAAGADVLLAIATVRESYRGTDWGKVAECICDAIDAAIAASGRQS